MEKIRHCYHKKAKPTLTIWNRGGDGVISNNLTNKKKICETTIKKIENKNKVKKRSEIVPKQTNSHQQIIDIDEKREI